MRISIPVSYAVFGAIFLVLLGVFGALLLISLITGINIVDLHEFIIALLGCTVLLLTDISACISFQKLL